MDGIFTECLSPQTYSFIFIFIFSVLVFQALHSEIQVWGGDRSRKSTIGDLWEILDGKEKARMPGSPTAQGERILGAGSQGRVPPPGQGMLQKWVRGAAPVHPTSGAQWDLPALSRIPR